MLGSTGTAIPFRQRPLRRRATAWLAVLAFSLAQILLGAHVHAATGSDEPPEALCAACAFVDDGQLSGHVPANTMRGLHPRLTQPQPTSAVAQQQSNPIQPRAPPAS